jgi:hypothetical protein
MRRIITAWLAIPACFVVIGCVPSITNSYRATVVDDFGQVSVRRAVIRVVPGVKVEIYGECFPRSDICRIVIDWYYPKSSDVAFPAGYFLARDVKDHGTVYGGASRTSAHIGMYGDKRDEVENMMGLVVDLGERLPRELELLMPQLKVDGVLHEMPVIRFKHSKDPGLLPVIYNY